MKSLLPLLFSAAALAFNVIPHTAVVPFPEVPAETPDQIAAAHFKPFMNVIMNAVPGCAVFPAVDADGNVSGGLKLGGSSNGDCKQAPHGGQVYVRGSQLADRYALMYSWFWPKDQEFFGQGHRYDWESAVVFINNVNASAEDQIVIEVAASAHGQYRKYAPPNPAVMQGNHAAIKYYTDGILDHSLDTYDNAPLGENPFLPMIHWDQLSAAAQDTLQNFDFGNANVPFKEGNFQRNLGLANAA